MPKQYLKALSNQIKRPQKITPVLVVVLVAAVGTILLIASHAASPYASITADQGTTGCGASVTTDATASDGHKVVFGSCSAGPTYYITQTGGGDGSSCSSPQSASWFNNTNGNNNWTTTSDSTTLIGPGDTVDICANASISTPLTFQGSGTSGNPITLYFQPQAKVSMAVCPSSGCINTNDNSYITINGGALIPENTPLSPGTNQCDYSSGYSSGDTTCDSTNGCDYSSCDYPIPDGSDGCTGTAGCMQNGIVESNANGSSLANQTPGVVGVCAANCTNGPLYNPTTHSGYQPTTDVTIENLDVENMYVKTQYTDHTDDANDDNHAIQYAGSNLTVAYNTAHDAGFALFGTADSSDSSSSGDSNVNVYGNDIYNVDHGFAIGDSDTSGATITDDSIHNNYIHDYANWDTPVNPANNTPYYHHDGLHCYAGGTPPTYNGLYIYNNNFNGDGSRLAPGTAQIFMEGAGSTTPCSNASSSIWIFNNYLTTTNGSITSDPLLTAASGTLHIYNNTLVGQGPSLTYDINNNDVYSNCTSLQNNDSGNGEIYFENNILSNCDGLMSINNTYEKFASGNPDYNLYASSSSDPNGGENAFGDPDYPSSPAICTDWGGSWPFTDETGNGSGDAFKDIWQPCTGVDAHSSAAVDAELKPDGSLQSGSPAIGAGTNLTSLCNTNPPNSLPSQVATALCQDINGKSRGSSWDIGAYQY